MIDINKDENGEITSVGIWHPLLDGEYHHFVQVYDGDKTKYYVDDKKVDLPLKGKRLSTRTWPYMLTEEEIIAEFNKGSGAN